MSKLNIYILNFKMMTTWQKEILMEDLMEQVKWLVYSGSTVQKVIKTVHDYLIGTPLYDDVDDIICKVIDEFQELN